MYPVIFQNFIFELFLLIELFMNMLLNRYQLAKTIDMHILDDHVINRTKTVFLNYQKENYPENKNIGRICF